MGKLSKEEMLMEIVQKYKFKYPPSVPQYDAVIQMVFEIEDLMDCEGCASHDA